MNLSCRTFAGITLLAAIAGGTACAPAMAPHSSRAFTPLPAVRKAASAPSELLLDADLTTRECRSPDRGVSGHARMKVTDPNEPGAASELEYELWIENPDRLPLSEAVIALSGMSTQLGPGEVIVPLWTGETSNKLRVRMRGILALPRGVSTTEVAAALRERRSALQLRVADLSGAAAACGDLRN